MFSRTTMASSISRPIASESASSVIVFNVKSNTHMMKNARDDRDRQREAGDDRRAPGVQEQVDDQDREHGAEHDRQLARRRATRGSWRESSRMTVSLMSRGKLALELRHRRRARCRRRRRCWTPEILSTSSETAVRLFALPRDLGHAATLLGAIDDRGDVAELTGTPLRTATAMSANAFGIDDAAGDADEPLGGAARDASRGHFLVLARQCLREQYVMVEAAT